MFPYIGIMADEEPKDSISPSGLYNSSESTATKNDFSTPLIGSLSEFTFMMWVYVPTAITYITPYAEKGAYSGNLMPFIIQNGKIGSSITNSNGGRTVVDYFTTVPKDEFIHITVTGSVLNNRIRMYLNGSLGQSAVMTYANDVSTSSFLSLNQTGFSISHVNAFNRELSEAEVAEHYVYDDDLLFAGVLGYDAMTASQRNGLVYSSSYTNTISIAGNEFTDKSGNGITLSPQPSLTGQQIYVYTDANDLPSTTTIYPVNSANLNGSSQYFDAGNPTELQITSSIYVGEWVKPSSTSEEEILICKYSYSDNQRGWVLRTRLGKYEAIFSTDGTTTFDVSSLTNVSSTEYVHVAMEVSNNFLGIYINGILDNSIATGVNNIHNSTANLRVGAYDNSTGSGLFEYTGALYQPVIFDRVTTSQEKLALAENPLKCWDSLTDENPSLLDAVYAPKLGNYDNNAGQELVDQSPSGITTTNIGSTPFTGTGLSVECGGTPTAPSNALPSNLPTIL